MINSPFLIENVELTTFVKQKLTCMINDKENTCYCQFQYHWLEENVSKIIIVVFRYLETVFRWGVNEWQCDYNGYDWVTVDKLREVHWGVGYAEH